LDLRKISKLTDFYSHCYEIPHSFFLSSTLLALSVTGASEEIKIKRGGGEGGRCFLTSHWKNILTRKKLTAVLCL